MESSNEMLLRELSYLSFQIRSTKKDRLPPKLRDRVVSAGYGILRRSSDSRTAAAAEELIRAGKTGNAEKADLFLGVLRNQMRRQTYPDAIALELRARLNELQSENDDLRDQLDAVTRDRQENAVKKFAASKNRVFVIMPFDHEFDDVWMGGIRRACDDCGFASLRVDQVSLSSWITDDVEEYIEKSNTVVADVTDSNPNVMFELGFAIGKDRNIVIISQHRESEKVPFDISGIRRLEYQNSWQGIETLSKRLKEFLQATNELQGERKAKPTKQK